ncbi:ribonuclease H-like protein, partial [Polyplosphaeria fusca]
KRKRGPTYYAVQAGRNPGVYHDWDTAKAEVNDFAGAKYKGFDTLAEAEEFVRQYTPSGNTPSSNTPSRNAPSRNTPQKFYAVARGRVPGIYTSWDAAKAQVTKYQGNRHRSFPTRVEAEGWLATERGISPTKNSAPKKQKKSNYTAVPFMHNGDFEPGMGPLPAGSEDGFDRTIKLNHETGNIEAKSEAELNAQIWQPTGEFSGPLQIWTDGSSLGNGQLGAVGGVGVYFGANHPQNISEPLNGERQTNQRAELTAVKRAIDIAPLDRDVQIITDSNYAIKCVTEWCQKWRVNNWKNSGGKNVENKDLIEPILDRIDVRNLAKAQTEFKWVKGHSTDEGNIGADLLATNGAR